MLIGYLRRHHLGERFGLLVPAGLEIPFSVPETGKQIGVVVSLASKAGLEHVVDGVVPFLSEVRGDVHIELPKCGLSSGLEAASLDFRQTLVEGLARIGAEHEGEGLPFA